MEAPYEIHNPSRISKLKYCCSKFWPRLRLDMWSYWSVHYMDLFFNIMTTAWLLTGTILFVVGCKTNNIKVWIWSGIISAVVPLGLWLMIGLIGVLLYCRKVYLESSDELTRQSSGSLHTCVVGDSFVVDSKIIRI